MLWYASLAPRQILPEALRKAVLTKGVLNLSTSILRILRKATDDEWTATHFSMMKYLSTSKGKHISLLQKIISEGGKQEKGQIAVYPIIKLIKIPINN